MKDKEETIRSKENFLVFGSPFIQEDEINEVVATLRSGWIGTGPKVARLEDLFRRYKGVRNAIAVNSGTAALHLACLAAEIRPGDEVITTAMTFCASVNAIIHSGATPVLVDSDEKTMNIDPSRVGEKISPKTKAMLIVHFAGRPCEMGPLMDIAKKHQLIVIEDCAHAIETEYHGKKAGVFGLLGCFSFYATKNMTTGEGGMIITESDDLAARIKVLALHGMSHDAWKRFGDAGYKHYQVVECGFKYNMMDLQASLGIHQLARIEGNWKRRNQIWNRYNKAFCDLPIGIPEEPDLGTRHAYHLYTILIDEMRTNIHRDAFLDGMTAQHIGVGVHYLSLPEHPYYQKRYGWRPEDYPHAMRIGRQTVSLPLSAKLTDDDVEDVITAVKRIIH
jgi:dTDP-4-amino-4,6-dideoxygalactose transaminase